MSGRCFRSAALCCFGVFYLGAQQAPLIRMTTKEVVLDLVVRDKHGHLIENLEPNEVTVYEDGVPQKITSFRNVQGAEQLKAENAAAKAEAASKDVQHPLNSLRELNFVSIVFAPMLHANLALAREAVQDFLKSDVLPNTYVTVFVLDTRLRLVQPYTHNRAALLTAVDRVTKGNYLLASRHLASSALANPGPVVPTGPGADPLAGPNFDPRDTSNVRTLTGLDASTSLDSALQAEASLETRLRFVESTATGMTILDSLRELVMSQGRLPGRKLVLYLSDGLRLPMDRARLFSDLVSTANRSGVTFYTVDTRGLTAPYGPQGNPLDASISQLNRTIQNNQAMEQGVPNTAQTIGAQFDASRASDDVALLAVSNTQLALRELAERTGGFAVANTNELEKPMERVMEEIRTHYELAYSPASEVYDGHFRKIEVKVDRPKVTVQTRSGYYALPDLNGQPLQPFEMAALQAINTRPAPRNLPYQVDLMEFRPVQDRVQCEVAFEVPIAPLKIAADPKTGKSRLQVSLVALIQDARGQVIGKVSRQLFRTISAADTNEVRTERIDYAEPLELPPGHYTLASAVLDGESNAVAVKRVAEFVKATPEVGLSSLEVVKRVAPLAGERNFADPFEMQNGRVIPSLDTNTSAGKPVDLFFVIYPSRNAGAEPPMVSVDLLKDGKEIGRMNPELPKPDSTGAIPMIAELKPPPGEYEVRVTVKQSAASVQSGLALTVQ